MLLCESDNFFTCPVPAHIIKCCVGWYVYRHDRKFLHQLWSSSFFRSVLLLPSNDMCINEIIFLMGSIFYYASSMPFVLYSSVFSVVLFYHRGHKVFHREHGEVTRPYNVVSPSLIRLPTWSKISSSTLIQFIFPFDAATTVKRYVHKWNYFSSRLAGFHFAQHKVLFFIVDSFNYVVLAVGQAIRPTKLFFS
jgi:hypothetical protein